MEKTISVTKNIDGADLMNAVAKYMDSKTNNNSTIETGSDGKTYTILVTPSTNTSNTKSNHVFITIQMSLYESFCLVSYTYSKKRPVFNVALAAIAAPIFIPASGVFLATSAFRLIYNNRLRENIFKFIESYVN